MSNLLSHLFDLVIVQPFELVSNHTPRKLEDISHSATMAPHLRSAGSNNLYAGYEEPKQAPRGRYAPRNSPRPAGEDKAKSAKKSGKKGKGKTSVPRASYADHGTSMTPSPGKAGRSTPKKTPSPGGISKTPRGSKQRTPPSSPQDPSLVKRNGRRVDNNLQIIPERVAEGRVTKRFPPVQSARVKGMYNRREDCYRNAALQALFHVPAFYRYLGKMHKNCRNSFKDCVVCSMQFLAQAYYNMPMLNVVSTQGLPRRTAGPLQPLLLFNRACRLNPPTDEVLWDMIEQFKAESQSDAWTFAQWLLMLLQDKELPSDDVSFSHMFELTSEESWTCDRCGETFTRQVQEANQMPREGYGLSVTIRDAGQSTTLVEFLEHHFEVTMRRRCQGELCSDLNVEGYEGPKQRMIRRLTKTPEVLLIQIIRFSGTADLGIVKFFDAVQFEEYLNLGPFTKDGDDVMYRLDGVVAHKGRSIVGGHYMAAVRDVASGRFVRANDDTQVGVSNRGRGSIIEMQRPSSWGADFEPYVLMYSKM